MKFSVFKIELNSQLFLLNFKNLKLHNWSNFTNDVTAILTNIYKINNNRATMSRDEEIRLASLNSLVEVVKQDNEGNGDINLSLLVLQTWLEQFARTNGGISPSEYCAPDRVRLLQSLMTITDNMTNSSENCNTNAFRYVNYLPYTRHYNPLLIINRGY